MRILHILLCFLWIAGSTTTVSIAQQADSQPTIVPCTYLVKFRDLSSLTKAKADVGKFLTTGESFKYPYHADQSLLKHSLGLWLQLQTCRADIIQKVKNQPGFAFLEEKRTCAPLYIPSDPQAAVTGLQYAQLQRVLAYQAWDSTQGDTSVFIGILDTGTDFTHEDLGNVAKKYSDTINGIDDDNNGLVDDFWGYDLADMDNDPHPLSTSAHGTNVAGISSATTDNGRGIAGLGFKCRYRPYKIYGAAFKGFEALVLASQDGCKVINCSWGRNGYPAQWEKEVIDYVTNVKHTLVVAAAGNTTGQFNFFPASYPGVVSVGFTNLNDLKHNASTVSPLVDIVAPGGSVYGIQENGMYGNIGGGSSFACPMVAAGAALILSKWPNLLPYQVEAQLKAYSDVVDTLPANRLNRGLMGAGRLNLNKALSSQSKYVGVLGDPIWKDANDALLSGGDTVSFNICFKSLLTKIPGITLQIKSLDTSLVVLNSQFSNSDSVGLQGICSGSFPFSAYVKTKAVINRQVALEVTATSPTVGYSQKLYIVVKLKVVFITVGTFNQQQPAVGAQFTGTFNGRLGYLDDYYVVGDGFQVGGKILMGEAGLVLARDSTHVLSTLIGQVGRDKDFAFKSLPLTGIDTARHLHWASFLYNDSTAPVAARLGVRVRQLAYVVKDDSLNQSGFNEFTIWNTSSRPIDSLYAGVITDWNIGVYNRNVSRFNQQRRIGFTFNKQTGEACGTLLISPTDRYGFTGIDLATGVSNNINVFDGYSRGEKFKTISGFSKKPYAGYSATIGENTINGHGTRLDSVSSLKSTRFAAVLLYGVDTNALKMNSLSAETYFRNNHSGPRWQGTLRLTLCKGDTAVLNSLQSRFNFYLSGRQRIGQGTGLSVAYTAGQDSLEVFAANADSAYEGMPVPISIHWVKPQAAFMLASDTIDINALPLPVTGTQLNAATVRYTIYRNGVAIFETDQQNFNLTDSILNAPGNYRLCQVASFTNDCVDTVCKDLTVLLAVNTKELLITKLVLIPNPANRFILVKKLPGGYGLEPIITDATGRRHHAEIMERNSSQILLSVADLPDGFYTINYGTARIAFVKASN